MAATCVDFVFRHRSDYGLVAPGVLTLARGKVAQARALIEHTDTAWWFDGVDLRAQAGSPYMGPWTSSSMAHRRITMAWRGKPIEALGALRTEALGNQITSTLYGPYLTSELVAYDKRAGDYYCQFPLAWWSMCFLEDVRVFETWPSLGLA